jgi:hypothetical protein
VSWGAADRCATGWGEAAGVVAGQGDVGLGAVGWWGCTGALGQCGLASCGVWRGSARMEKIAVDACTRARLRVESAA